MESLSDTVWDVVICGTGLQQSLLALALSRSDKNILHIDPNPYYGGSEAALSLAEADEWAAAHEGASVTRRATATSTQSLAPQSAYSIALAPQLLHARSALVNLLVSSRAFRQLEFLAVSSFFVLELAEAPPLPPSSSPSPTSASPPPCAVVRIPATREDVFASTAMPVRAKRQLMKFLKFVLAYDGEGADQDGGGGDGERESNSATSASRTSSAVSWREHASEPLGGFLQSVFGLDDRMRDNVLSLTLSLDGASVTVGEGLARLHRHITSMGVFGAGFAAVYPKWGGYGEIVQVACRAAAVGGAVYMLGSGTRAVKAVEAPEEGESQPLLEIDLTRDMTVKAKLLVTGSDAANEGSAHQQRLGQLIAVVGAPLPFLFAPTVEGAPVAGGAVIALPAGRPVLADGTAPEHPIFAMAHSSDTGECPPGQCVLHLATIHTVKCKAVLEHALDSLLAAFGRESSSSTSDEDSTAAAEASASPIQCLYTMYYEQPRNGSGDDGSNSSAMANGELLSASASDGPAAVLRFPPLPVDLTSQDAQLEAVRAAWRRVMGGEADEDAYMVFEDREGSRADDDEYE